MKKSRAIVRRHDVDLLPGLRWTGKLRVLGRTKDGGFIVDFDAYDAADKQYVMDRTVLTPKQYRDWTGRDK